MSVVVFDFDGTLADSFKVALDIYNTMAKEKGHAPVSEEDWQRLRYMHIGQGLKYIGVKPYQVPGLLAQGRRMLKDRTGDIYLFRGIPALIKRLSSEGHNLFVLSTNSKIIVEKVLTDGGVNEYVKVLKSAPLFGKAAVLKKLTKQTGSKSEDVWMIGDEIRDGQAARKAGVNFIAVNWGLQPKEILESTKPRAIAMVPSDIADLIK
jgi:phosphoglycolate phosphatase